LADRINDNVGPVNDDEMAALRRNNLLAILRKGQQLGLEFIIFGGTKFICTYIDERLVPERRVSTTFRQALTEFIELFMCVGPAC